MRILVCTESTIRLSGGGRMHYSTSTMTSPFSAVTGDGEPVYLLTREIGDNARLSLIRPPTGWSVRRFLAGPFRSGEVNPKRTDRRRESKWDIYRSVCWEAVKKPNSDNVITLDIIYQVSMAHVLSCTRQKTKRGSLRLSTIYICLSVSSFSFFLLRF